MDKTEILNRLDKSRFYREHIPSLQINGKPEALGLCPFHDDHTPSMSVNFEAGLYHCLVCGAGGDVFTFYQKIKDVDFRTALRELGEMAGVVEPDIKPIEKIPSKIECVYPYTDEAGKILFEVVRFVPKTFRQRHPDGKGGYIYNITGVRLVPYNLPAVIASDVVYVCEGEKDCDNLAKLGLVATTNPQGAGKWREEFGQYLSGKNVVILCDNDEAGLKHGYDVAQKLYRSAKSIKVVEQMPGVPLKGDVSDWLMLQGNTKEKLLEIIENTPAWTPTEKPLKLDDTQQNETKIIIKFNLTDLGNAKRLVERNGEHIRYCYAWKKWLVWDGKVWRIDDNGQILRLAKGSVKRIYKESFSADEDIRQAVAKWAIKSEEEKKLNSMVSLAKSEDGVPISPQELDANSYLLNCLNGTIDLKTGRLEPHNPKNFITKIIPVEYDPAAQCPQWIEFLETIMNWNYDLISFLQRAIGYSLTGDTSEQCLFLLHGAGANGKSTLLNIIGFLLGDYAQTAIFDTFLAKKEERSVNNDIARMQGKRFVSAIESEGERRLSEVLVKQLTGGDTITARYLFAEFFEFIPQFKIWLACNHKPVVRGTDLAIWRRIRLIPFNITIPEAERDKHLSEKLQAELPGILAWAVQGCLEWQRGGLKTPAEVKQATNEYQGDMDTIGAFLSECCILTPEVKAKASELYGAYKEWCEAGGEHALSQRCFGLRLTEKGLKSVKSSGNYWKGVGIIIEK